MRARKRKAKRRSEQGPGTIRRIPRSLGGKQANNLPHWSLSGNINVYGICPSLAKRPPSNKPKRSSGRWWRTGAALGVGVGVVEAIHASGHRPPEELGGEHDRVFKVESRGTAQNTAP